MVGFTPARAALVSVLAATAWLALNVWLNYEGHLAGVFHTGRATGGTDGYRAKSDAGYDGQFYRMAAHDPLIRGPAVQHVDNPRLRWRRIGVPGLAALLSLGRDSWVDPAFVVVELAFVFLGAYWLAALAHRHGRSEAWGLAFLTVPAVAVSLDRMTIDLPLAALTIGLFVLPPYAILPILCAAPLVRETGMLLVAAMAVESVLRRDWVGTVIRIGCSLPALAWWAFVHSRTPADATSWLSTYPYSGLIERTMAGNGQPTHTAWLQLASAFEELAIVGIWLAIALSAYLAWRRRWGVPELAAILFAAFAATLGKYDIWSSAYAAGRTMSPLLVSLAVVALSTRRWGFAAPLGMVLPRIALQYEAQLASMF